MPEMIKTRSARPQPARARSESADDAPTDTSGETGSTMHKQAAKQVDKEIGVRLRQARRAAKLSQTDIANAVGVSSQQIQKYEVGKNRVAVSTLIRICDALGIKVSAFLDGFNEGQRGVRDFPQITSAGLEIAHRISRLPPKKRDIIAATLRAVEESS